MARFEMSSSEFTVEGQSATSDILFQMGVMYATGRTVPYDLVSAHKWFNIAAQRGSEEARRYRREVALEMSSDQLAVAQREAREWMTCH